MPNFSIPSRLRVLLIATFTLLATAAFAQHYQRTNLVVDSNKLSAATIDPNLVNAWGLSRGTGSPFWISDNGTGVSTLYDSTGAIVPLVVKIPPPKGGTAPSAPTGTVFNFTTGFNLGPPGTPAIFLFSTEDGTVAGWNPSINATTAVRRIDHSQTGAIFKGLAIAMTALGPRLYTTNFATGKVEVYDTTFTKLPTTGFMDSQLPPDFVPFGIQNVGGNIVVTFAHRLPGSEDEDHGFGLGYVDVFDDQGKLLLRLQHGDFLNAPWGIALAPSDFGPFSHRLLIGNFGNGRIHAFNAVSGKFQGTMLNMSGSPVTIDGLWALSFGSDAGRSGLATELFFTAGPNDESDGLFGKLTASASEQRGNSE
jgi:uncharacterized protein (TIGR03118 family)